MKNITQLIQEIDFHVRKDDIDRIHRITLQNGFIIPFNTFYPIML